MSFVSEHIQLTELAPGVYAALARPGGIAEANAGIVDLGGRTLVFDTLMSHIAAADLRRAAEALTGQPVCYVCNSHWHLDHIRGNQVFDQRSTVIATALTRRLIATHGQADLIEDMDGAYLALVRRRIETTPEPELREEWHGVLRVFERISAAAHEVRIRLPELTFERRLTLSGTAREVTLLSHGGGETASDAVLYLPDEQILFAGDLVSVGMQPLVTGGDVAEWERILNELATLPLRLILPGHGPVGTAADLELTSRYLRRLMQAVREAAVGGPDADCELPAPGAPFDRWGCRRFWAMNLRHLLRPGGPAEPRTVDAAAQ